MQRLEAKIKEFIESPQTANETKRSQCITIEIYE